MRRLAALSGTFNAGLRLWDRVLRSGHQAPEPEEHRTGLLGRPCRWLTGVADGTDYQQAARTDIDPGSPNRTTGAEVEREPAPGSPDLRPIQDKENR